MFVFIFLVITVETQSQLLISLLLGDKINSDDLEFGLEGGINYSRTSGLETKAFHPDWNMGFYFEAGPQFGLMHKAWGEFNYDLEGKKK